MFCPSCGFESTQKTNYCKRCGESLSIPTAPESPKVPRLSIVIMFCAIAAFGLLGLIALFAMHDNLVKQELRGDELIIPFLLGMIFIGAIAGLLVWQLARIISVYQRTNKNVVIEKHYIREVPQAQLGVPTDQISPPVEIPSVVEHTTRQFANPYRDPNTQ